MISLVEETRVPAKPERVWRFFRELDLHYRDWHPEHLDWRTLRGQPLVRGTVWFADEWIGPLRISSRFFVTDSRPPTFFSYRIGFPSSLGRVGGSFRLLPARDGECELISGGSLWLLAACRGGATRPGAPSCATCGGIAPAHA